MSDEPSQGTSDLSKSRLVLDVQTLRRGHIRMQTVFVYPDGSNIDIFERHERDSNGNKVLSDLGGTSNWLSMLGIGLPLAKRRLAMLNGVLDTCKVKLNGDALERVLDSQTQPEHALVQLASACIRYSDLMFTRKPQDVGDFKERIELSLLDYSLNYEMRETLLGRNNRPVEVDFLVHGEKLNSAVFALNAKSQQAAKANARMTFAKVHDLGERPEQKVVLYDDQSLQWPDSELERFVDLGTQVYAYSQHEEWRPVLAA